MNTIPGRWFARLGAVAAATGATVGALVLTGPAADAAPAKPIRESTIKSECASAGGTYGTSVEGGERHSACWYDDNEGNGYVDLYTNGTFHGTVHTT